MKIISPANVWTFVVFSLGAILNHFANNPRILYLPALAVCFAILYHTHGYVVRKEVALHVNELDKPHETPLSTPMKDERPNKSITTTNQSGGQNIITDTLNVGQQPRRLTVEQVHTLASSFKGYASGRVGFQLDPNVEDGELFANDIAAALVEAGIKISFIDNIMNVGPRQRGVTVGVFQGDVALRDRIVKALGECKIDVRAGNGDHRRPGDTVIQIGHR